MGLSDEVDTMKFYCHDEVLLPDEVDWFDRNCAGRTMATAVFGGNERLLPETESWLLERI